MFARQPAPAFKNLLRWIIGEASEDASVGGAALAVGGGETSSLLGNKLANGLCSVRVNLDNISRCSKTHIVPHRRNISPECTYLVDLLLGDLRGRTRDNGSRQGHGDDLSKELHLDEKN